MTYLLGWIQYKMASTKIYIEELKTDEANRKAFP